MLEKEAENLLERNKFCVVKRKFIKNRNQLEKTKLNFPWVMKVVSKRAVHKAKIRGVITNINNLKKAEEAFRNLKKIKGFKGVMLQETAKGQEIILGLKKTPEFNHVILVGAGGSIAEKIKDISFRVCPITKKDADKMLNELKIRFNDCRMKKIAGNLVKLSQIAKKYPKIIELDINPLIVNEKQAVIVDARIVLE